MNEDAFLLFGLAFFLFTVYIILHENRRDESRRDKRNDIEYERLLNERREFGYDKVQEANRKPPSIFQRK